LLLRIRRPFPGISRPLAIFFLAIGTVLLGARLVPVAGQVEPAKIELAKFEPRGNEPTAKTADEPTRAASAGASAGKSAGASATWITIRLPITGDVDTRIIEQIERARQRKSATDARPAATTVARCRRCVTVPTRRVASRPSHRG